jgi:hypothetical protein
MLQTTTLMCRAAFTANSWPLLSFAEVATKSTTPKPELNDYEKTSNS